MALLCACSGDMYTTVPRILPSAVACGAGPSAVSVWRLSDDCCFASPKSRTFTRPSCPTITLAGFESRWVMPRWWAVYDGVGERDRDSQQLGERHPAGSDAFRQRLPLDKLHRQEEQPCFFLDGMNRDDARMVERGNGTRFALESRAAVGVARGLVSEDLQRHLASELRVFGQVDLAHAARRPSGRRMR